MNKSEEKKLTRRYERGMKYGWSDIVRLKGIYPFQLWMQDKWGWRLFPTEGNELAVLFQDGKYIRIWWNALLRKCCTDRLGMGMYLIWENHKEGLDAGNK